MNRVQKRKKPVKVKKGGLHKRKPLEREEIAGIAVKSVDVVYPTSNSGVGEKAPVTMPRAPWE